MIKLYICADLVNRTLTTPYQKGLRIDDSRQPIYPTAPNSGTHLKKTLPYLLFFDGNLLHLSR